MKHFFDYSPATLPSHDEHRDALQKGLGRALQWAMAGKLDEELLLDACLHDKRHDHQIDSIRGDWLWQIIQTVQAEDRFRSSLFLALQNLAYRDAEQLCELGFCYAANGDDAFRSRLYEIVESRPITDEPWLGEKEILKLDGEIALLKAANFRGTQLKQRSWEWEDGMLVDEAVELLGEELVGKLLEASTDEGIEHFYRLWLKTKEPTANKKQPLSHAERMQQIKVEEIIAAAESASRQVGLFVSWGKWSNEDDLEQVHQRLAHSQNPESIRRYLMIFTRREYHPAIPIFIQLCDVQDEEISRRAFQALENNSHSLVRQFAENKIQNGRCDNSVLGLFINNYREGDEDKIFETLVIPDNECTLHWLLSDVIKLLERNTMANPLKLGIMSYAMTPCASCRGDAGRLLYSRNAAPPWMIEECKYDAEPENRTLTPLKSKTK